MRKEECGYWPNWIVSFSSLSSCDTSTSGLSFHILWKVDLEQWFMLSSWSSQVPSNWPFESLITIDCRWWSRWYLAKCGEKLQVRKEASFVPTPAAETRGLCSTRGESSDNLKSFQVKEWHFTFHLLSPCLSQMVIVGQVPSCFERETCENTAEEKVCQTSFWFEIFWIFHT